MNKIWCSLSLLFVFCAASSYSAEVTLTGKVTCAKCDLKVSVPCATVIVVKEDKKDVVYYFTGATGTKYHKEICTTPTEGTVTGEVSMQGEKHLIKVSKVELKK